jgi:predicted DNA-binding protein
MSEQKTNPKPKPKRSGVPFTLYLSNSQARALDDISDRRQVPKSTLVRYAVERLLIDLENGQLKLPIGI